MGDEQPIKKLLLGKPESRRKVARPKLRWRDAVEKDLPRLDIRNWITTATDRDAWKTILGEAKAQAGL